MNANFELCLDRYAALLVQHGMNVQQGQIVNLTGELIHRDFLNKVAAEAYRAGAKFVNIDLVDPQHAHTRITESRESDYLNYVPPYIPAKFNNLVDHCGAVLRLLGSEDPDILADLPPEAVNNMQLQFRKSLKNYYEEGVGHSKVQWTVAAAATPQWGQKVFPELDPEAACQALWEQIFRICRVDKPDFLSLWQQHNVMLQQRAKVLTDLKIKELQFTGPDTDLKVYLTPAAIFVGGGSYSPRGVHFECNIPTEECFTTPDYRLTSGYAKVTRPFMINGKLIKGLKLTFKDGRIVDFSAAEGESTFAEYIKSDEGACRLGEVALVGVDSPIFQSGRVFEEILFDENAACHIAVGFAYRFCLEGSAQMSSSELDALGCNDSHVHTDMMLSNEMVDVWATTHSGQRLPLIVKGVWQPDFC